MTNGWVLIWREMFEDKLWLSEPFTRGQAWVDLILLANHAPGSFYIRGNVVKVKRGQVSRSETALAERWQWSRGKVRRYIRMLETGQQIVQQKNFLITLITITNYDRYQPVNGKVVQQNPKSNTADSTADGTADGTHTKKDKEELKKVKEKRKVFSPPSVEEVQGYISEKGYNVNANNFVDFYESKGWMVGRNKMKAWKAAVRNWATRNKTDKKTERITFDENGIPHVT